MDLNWTDEFKGAITVCDRQGVIVYMNELSIEQFAKYGGKTMIGSSLIDCHPEPAKSKLIEMLKNPIENAYTIEKKGIRKMILQTPWMQDRAFMGVVEISFKIPNPTPHYVRSE